MSQGQTQGRKVVELSFPATRYSNTFDYTLLFSLKQKRFIRPVLAKHLEFTYKILEGTYLLLSWGPRWSSPLTVQKIKYTVNEQGVLKEEVLAKAEWDILQGWKEDPNCPQIIKDFIAAKPGCFHCYPDVDYSKVYSEEDIAALLKGGYCGRPEE